MKLKHFLDAWSFRKWLAANHGKEKELLVGLRHVGSGKKSITYPEALDEALCIGWIDGVRQNAGPGVYTIRFTPRKAKSNWSVVNIRRVKELIKLGRMKPEGLRVYEARDERRTERYSYERKACKLSRAQQRQFRENAPAWEFFKSQAPWYQRVTTWWVVSAVKPETRERRLAELVRDSAAGRCIHLVASNKQK